MAHLIENRNGVSSFVENGKKQRAWHGLGQVFDGQLSVKEAIQLSHADYEVEKRNVFAMTPELEKVLAGDEEMISRDVLSDILTGAYIDGRKATMRMDVNETLGVVTDSYGVVQNADAFQFIDNLCTGGRADTPVIECAGVLGHGERVFITAKFPEDIILDNKGNDRVEMYIVFTTSHDGTGAVNCMVTPIRVVCNNTLNMALGRGGNAGKISLRHTSGVSARLDLTKRENAEFAYRTLNLYSVYKQSLEESLEHLRNIKLSENQLNDILAEVLLSDANLKLYKEQGITHQDITSRGRNLFLGVRNAVEGGIGQELSESGTGLWLINGITTYFQNEKRYSSDELKFDTIIGGDVSSKLQKAYNLLMAV